MRGRGPGPSDRGREALEKASRPSAERSGIQVSVLSSIVAAQDRFVALPPELRVALDLPGGLEVLARGRRGPAVAPSLPR